MAIMKDMFEWLVTPPPGGGGEAWPPARDGAPGVQPGEQPLVDILLGRFDGDENDALAQRLAADLDGQDRVQVRTLTKTLRPSGKGSLVERMVSAAETGRKWLAQAQADILLWGEISDDGRAVILRFLCSQADGDARPGSIGLGDTLELPIQYSPELAALVRALVQATVGTRKSSPQRDEVAEMLNGPVEKLDAYVEAPPTELRRRSFLSVMAAVGNVMASMWRLTRNPRYLDRAVKAYRLALDNSYDAESPLPWALAQNHLASSLQAQSVRDNDAEPLKGAVGAYQSVATALGPDSHPNDWALAHARLGDVLVKLSRFELSIQHLKAATHAYQLALRVFTRETMPGPWSELMNQLGVALMEMGEHVTGERVFEQSAACFRQSLEVRRREIAPLLWAQTSNNLGAVTFSLYRRTENTAVLKEAAACFKGASEVYLALGSRDKALVAHRNLEKIVSIQEREGGK